MNLLVTERRRIMIVTRNKIIPQPKEKMSWMARLFRVLVKIFLFPIHINENKETIKFSILSIKFFFYTIIYGSIPTLAVSFSMSNYSMEHILSFIKELMEQTTATDAVAMLGYTVLITCVLFTYFVVLLRGLGINSWYLVGSS